MITLSMQTIEKLILFDKKAQTLLPEFADLFKQWQFGLRGGLSLLCKQSIVDLMQLIKQEHIDTLEKYWGSPVIFQKIDSSIVRNYNSNIDSLETLLNNMTDFQDNVCISRNGDQVYLSFWR